VQRPHDAIRIEGVPPITMEIPGGIHGDIATWAIAVNTIPRLLASRSGLLVATALPAAP